MLNYKNPRKVEYGTQGRTETKVTATCFCGKEFNVALKNLKNGQKSCGCILGAKTTHGMKGTKIYNIWSGMKARCNNKKCNKYKYYGGRGISICSEWDSFTTFYKDMGDKPKGMSLDRINNNGNYEPSNCKWSTSSEQQHNMRSNIIFEGECAAEASRRLGGCKTLIHDRLKFGWSKKKAFTTPLQKKTNMIKKCTNCHQDKPEDSFYRSKLGTPWKGCKQCYLKKIRNKRSDSTMHYADYLEKAGLTKYKKRTARYQI